MTRLCPTLAAVRRTDRSVGAHPGVRGMLRDVAVDLGRLRRPGEPRCAGVRRTRRRRHASGADCQWIRQLAAPEHGTATRLPPRVVARISRGTTCPRVRTTRPCPGTPTVCTVRTGPTSRWPTSRPCASSAAGAGHRHVHRSGRREARGDGGLRRHALGRAPPITVSSFRGGGPIRGVTDASMPDIAWTPLFIKAPGPDDRRHRRPRRPSPSTCSRRWPITSASPFRGRSMVAR